MKKSTVNARGPAMKGQLALIKVRALMEADLVGPLLIQNQHFLKTLGCTPETFALARFRRNLRSSALH